MLICAVTASATSSQNLLHVLRAVLVRLLQVVELLVQVRELLLHILCLFCLSGLDVWDGGLDKPSRISSDARLRARVAHRAYSHLSHAIVDWRVFGKRIHLRATELQHPVLAVLGRDLRPDYA
jgi:hypothetical protein